MLNISVHDVTPKFFTELKEIFSELDKKGIDLKTILVIPNYELKYDISKDDNFLSWLSNLGGVEIMQHGYEHVSHNREYKSVTDWFWGEIFSQGCAEFQNIGYREAGERIQKGKTILKNAGIKATGFVTPAWLSNVESERAISDEGFSYIPTLWGINNFDKKPIYSPVLGFAPIFAVDNLLRLRNEYLLHGPLRKNNFIQVAIHPQDLRGKGTFKYAIKLIEKLKKTRKLTSYDNYIKSIS